MAIFLLFLLLSLVFWGALCHKVGYDAYEQKSEPPTVMQRIQEAFSMNQGIVLAYLEVAVLCAISVAFSTRFPLFLNITAIITIFMLGNLAPMMVQVAESDTRFKAGRIHGQDLLDRVCLTCHSSTSRPPFRPRPMSLGRTLRWPLSMRSSMPPLRCSSHSLCSKTATWRNSLSHAGFFSDRGRKIKERIPSSSRRACTREGWARIHL